MNKNIEDIKATRRNLLNVIEGVTVDQLNEIPPKLNNNIIWHLGHLVASLQGISYLRAGLEPAVDKKHFLAYRPDTKPEKPVDATEVELIKSLLITSIDQLETDYNNHIFSNYPAWTSRYGVEITSIDDALQFILYHEGLHLGYIMTIKRLVTTS